MVAVSSQISRAETFFRGAPSPQVKKQVHRVDLDSFNNLVLEYQDQVYRQAFWILGDEAGAEDATQEAFLRAYRSLNDFNGGPFLPWVLRIATNFCLDQLRRKKVRKNIPIDIYDEFDEEIETPSWIKDPNPSVEETLIRSEQQDWILQCLNRLPIEYKTAIILVDMQEIKYAEAAECMGVRLGTFKSRLARARDQLQKHLTSGPGLN